MGIMKHKKVKALLSAALVLSLIGGNNLSYVGAKNQQDIENTLKIEEQTNNAEQESEAEKEIPKEENEIPKEENDQMQSTPEESVEKDHIEDVEVIPAMPETESEKAETLEKNPEKVSKYGDEIPEIIDRAVLMEGRAGYSNKDDVCTGGGTDHDGPNTSTNRKNQDPKDINPYTKMRYWQYDNEWNPFHPAYTEKDLINKLWPKTGSIPSQHSFRMKDAVIDPQDRCFYANPKNGYGENVDNGVAGNYRKYYKYDAHWQSEKAVNGTPAPSGSATSGNGVLGQINYYNISYAGNYRWAQGGVDAGSWLFTIATRPKLWIGSETKYKDGTPMYYTDGDSFPRVYDNTERMAILIDTKDAMFQFEGKTGAMTNKRFHCMPSNQHFNDDNPLHKTPNVPGRYEVIIQTLPNASKFMLPGIYKGDAIYMKKGYTTKFVQKINGSREESVSWVDGKTPTEFDKETKKLFDIDLYPEEGTYQIPIPQYDEKEYIFEGWDVEEQYWTEPSLSHPHGQILVKTKSLSENNNGSYDYTPSAIGKNQYFVLEAKFIAKLRTKKTNTITSVTNVDGGDMVQGALEVNPTEIKVIEGEKNSQNFNAIVNSGYAYDFVGWSFKQGGDHNDLGSINTYNPSSDLIQQTEVHKTSILYATFKPKEYTIAFDGNGGTDSTKSSTTSTQTAKYYNNVQLAKNPFVREGFEFKGWSKTKNGSVDFADQGNGRNIPLNGLDKALNNDIPTEITLYAVWERNMAKVNVHKHKDTLWFEGARENAVVGGVYVFGNTTNFNVYEITRFYLDVATQDVNESVEKLDKTKFYVVWERSTDGGKKWTKINPQDTGTYITKAFTDNRNSGYSKVVYDAEKGKWFVPLLVRYKTNPTEATIGGQYRVSVAYDDPKATDKVTSEQDYYSGKARNGWTTSEPTEIKMISTFDTVIKVPSTITLAETTEVSQSGEKTDVIKSVPYVNEVTVNPVRHTIDGKTDYDWHTPNTAMDGKTTQSNSYNGGQYTEYTKQKPFKVSVNWDKTLTDTTKQYTVNTVEMYSAENIGTMKKDQKITTGTQSTFSYDGQESGKKLFSFYLKGEKSKHLPEGVLFKGQITFVIDNVR